MGIGRRSKREVKTFTATIGLQDWEYTLTTGGSSVKKNWAEAEAACQQSGGHLASIASAAVLEHLKTALPIPLAGSTWIGGNDRF